MHSALRSTLTDTIQVASQTGQDAYGVATYGTPVPRLGRLQKRMRTVFGMTGRQLVEDTRLYLDGDVPISASARVTLPDGTQPPIQNIETHKDEVGRVDHYTLFF